MSTTGHDHDDDHEEEVGAPVGGVSVLDSLRAQREERAQQAAPKRVLEVPGYNNRLVVRYRYPEGGYKAVTQPVQRARFSDDPDAVLYGNCDVLLACCETILGRAPDGTLVDLLTNESLGEPPGADVSERLRFDKRCAELLGIDVPSEVKSVGRHVIRHVFSPAAHATGVFDGDIAVMTQGGAVLAWLQDTSAQVAEDFTGES